MISGRALSDQLHDWSDRPTEIIGCGPAEATCCSVEATAAFEGCSPRLGNRAVQALRESGMPVRKRPRTRSQAVLIRQSIRSTAGNGVRACRIPRAGERVSGKPPTGTGGARGDLRDQPGASASQRGVGVAGHAGARTLRHCPRGHTCRQHDPREPGVRDPIAAASGKAGARGEHGFATGIDHGRKADAGRRHNR